MIFFNPFKDLFNARCKQENARNSDILNWTNKISLWYPLLAQLFSHILTSAYSFAHVNVLRDVTAMKDFSTSLLEPGLVSLWGMQHLSCNTPLASRMRGKGWLAMACYMLATLRKLATCFVCQTHRGGVLHGDTSRPNDAHPPLSGPPCAASWLEKRSLKPSSRTHVHPAHPVQSHPRQHPCLEKNEDKMDQNGLQTVANAWYFWALVN